MSSRANLRRDTTTGVPGAPAAAQAAADLQRGLALHQSGSLDGAEAAYRAVLQRMPRQADALHLLGVVHHQRGDSAKAVDLIRRSRKIDDSNPHTLINLGAALLALGRIEEAETTYKAALERLPDNAELHANLAAALSQRGDREGAIKALTKALTLAPGRAAWELRLGDLLLDHEMYPQAVMAFEAYLAGAPGDAAARNNLGVALEKLKRYEDARAQFQTVVDTLPELADGHANLGNALAGLGRFEESEACYRRAIELDPRQWRYRVNLANLLIDTGRVEDALAHCDTALALEPDNAEMLNELAARLLKARYATQAEEILRKALAIAPDFAPIHGNMAAVMVQQKRLEEAEGYFRSAARLDPDSVLHRVNLCGILQKRHLWDEAIAQAYGMLLSPQYSPLICDSRFLQVSREIADFDGVASMDGFWDTIEGLSAEEKAAAALTLLSMADDDAKLKRLAAIIRTAGEQFVRDATTHPMPPMPTPAPVAGRRIRLGFLSADFRSHSVAKFALPVFRSCDRERFEIFAYSAFPEIADPVQAEIRGLVDTYRTVDGLTNRAIAQQMRDDGIDIAFDLGGYTMHSRMHVHAYRPAPVQIAWIGWPFTTGIDQIDYFLCDRYTRPACDDYMVEKPLELSQSFLCFETFRDEPLAPPPFERNGHITFGTLNATYKYAREQVALWAEVMRAVEGSRMVIVRPEARSVAFLSNMVKEFESHGIGRERLDIINNNYGSAGHLSYYNLFDMSLDSFPITGGTTTADAMWMGVPVVSRMGPAFHQRIGGAIQRHCGLHDLVVETPQEFVRAAVTLANDRGRLASLRQSLRPAMRESPLCRVDKFMAGFEQAMLEVAKRHFG